MRIAFYVIFVGLGVASANAEQTIREGDSAAFEKAARVVDAFHEALRTGNREAALALLDEHTKIYEQGWVEESKAEYAAEHLREDVEFSAAVRRERLRRHGFAAREQAVIMTEERVAGKFMGKDVNSMALETMVLRRKKGAWAIVHVHWSSRNLTKNDH